MAEVADLIVAGAGPAGAAAACYFARLGFRVVLLDRCAFPRDKVCGDFVGPLALDELEALGIASHAAFGTTHRVRRAALHLDGRGIVERPLPCAGLAHDYGLCIPRKTLDSEIVREAVASGARLLEEACVTGYETGKSAATVVYRRARRMETV